MDDDNILPDTLPWSGAQIVHHQRIFTPFDPQTNYTSRTA